MRILAALMPLFLSASLAADDFQGAKWIGDAGEPETAWRRKEAEAARGVRGGEGHKLLIDRPLPKTCLRLRRRFTLPKKDVRRASVAVTGMGFYELWLNGRKVDPTRVLAPAMADPGRGVYYDVYEVGKLLSADGANAIGIWLSPGYSDDFSRFGWMWLAPKRAILRLQVDFADGTSEAVVSGGDWESTTDGPILSASIYHGEVYDAARENPAWASPKGDGGEWRGVFVFPDGPNLIRSDVPPVRLSDPRRPVSLRETSPGVWTADFGQNRAGVVRVRAKGPKGTQIVLRTSELVGEDGKIDPWTSRRARSTDEFILAGTGETEDYVPRFTYHGFRYVEITGWPGRPTEDGLVAYAVHADVKPTASFRCSDDMLNWLHNAATWSMLSNFVGFPTDCCMRDERTACRMDSQAYEDAACQFFDMRSYYAKWLDDGGKPTGGNPDWTGDVITLPHRLWRFYGGKDEFVRRYPAAKAYVDAQLKGHPDLIFKEGYGDWCAPNAGRWKDYFNDPELVNTAIFCKILGETAQLAELAGRTEDAKRYAERFVAAKQAFHRFFYRPETSSYGDGSQTTSVLPLAFGLVPDDCRETVSRALLRRIREKDGCKLDTGIYGTRYIGEVLCDLGEVDLLLRLYSQPAYPGFGFMRSKGATTLWEQWTFKGGMNSHNHAMFAGGASWLYTHLAGIRPAKPGYGEILLKPLFPKRLDFLSASRITPRGEVSVDWKREGGKVRLTVKAPAGVPTRLVLPDGSERSVVGALTVDGFSW